MQEAQNRGFGRSRRSRLAVTREFLVMAATRRGAYIPSVDFNPRMSDVIGWRLWQANHQVCGHALRLQQAK